MKFPLNRFILDLKPFLFRQLRDNYFGSFTHFVTLEEYRHRHERNLQGDPLELKYRPGAVSLFRFDSFKFRVTNGVIFYTQTDVFEVAVTLKLTNGLQILPQGKISLNFFNRFVLTNLYFLDAELFDCQSAVVLVLPQLQVDLRNHDFFMG